MQIVDYKMYISYVLYIYVLEVEKALCVCVCCVLFCVVFAIGWVLNNNMYFINRIALGAGCTQCDGRESGGDWCGAVRGLG